MGGKTGGLVLPRKEGVVNRTGQERTTLRASACAGGELEKKESVCFPDGGRGICVSIPFWRGWAQVWPEKKRYIREGQEGGSILDGGGGGKGIARWVFCGES